MVIENLKHVKSGKVRDIYDLGENYLFVASDRISAFDYVLPSTIPKKGEILTQLSLFWFDFFKDTINNHLVEGDFSKFPSELQEYKELAGRSIIVKKADPFPVECVVRGYISGSGWSEYKNHNSRNANHYFRFKCIHKQTTSCNKSLCYVHKSRVYIKNIAL